MAQDRNRFLSLSNELLAAVVGHFAASPDGFSLTRVSGANALRRSSAYDTLLSLSLSCHRLWAISRPLIYRVVEISDEPGMVLLIRTLLKYRELRPLVLHLGIGFEIEQTSRDDGYYAVISCWTRDIVPYLPADHQDRTVISYVDIGSPSTINIAGVHYGGIIGGIFAVLLYLTPKTLTL
ncbi:hypothetical protein BJ170DRAFT_597881 [Xylariales sp. AK1849]|nr:hypothetical protein BJ170DRAFT_597881 [Xylariales sp. AK1849]